MISVLLADPNLVNLVLNNFGKPVDDVVALLRPVRKTSYYNYFHNLAADRL